MSNRICVDCKIDISKMQLQCIRCKKCQKKFYKKRSKTFLNGQKIYSKTHEPLGTTDFDAHREKNFDKEATVIKKEMEDLGLR